MNTDPLADPSIAAARNPTGTASDSSQLPPIGNAKVGALPSGDFSLTGQSELNANFAHPSQTNQHLPNLMDEINTSIMSADHETLVKLMRGINLALASFTIASGVLAWILGVVTDFQKVIAGIYIILFGLLLLAFELRSKNVDPILRANVGFMFGDKTRTAFLLFMAIWPLSMGNFWLTVLDAVLLFINAFFNYYVVSQHPGFSHKHAPYDVTPAGAPSSAS